VGRGYAFCCEECDDSDPLWRLTRQGDVVTSWACAAHVSLVCDRLQRDWEITQIIVTHARKAREWADIGATLGSVG
jgi:hypothetical protein